MTDTLSQASVTNNVTAALSPEILNAQGTGAFLFLCDHASNHIPADLNNLGLPAAELQRHIAWDIGAAALTRNLSAHFNSPAILARASRLVVDVNRDVANPSAMPDVSDGTLVPGNQALSADQRQQRIDRFYTPFHDAVDAQTEAMLAQGTLPFLVGMHSFTPHMNGTARPWVVGLLWNNDPRLAVPMIEGFRARGLETGDNEPYSGRQLFYSMKRHGEARGLAPATLEIRQDQIDTAAGVERWTAIVIDVLSEALETIQANPDLCQRRYY